MRIKAIMILLTMACASFAYASDDYVLPSMVYPAVESPFLNRAMEINTSDAGKSFSKYFSGQSLSETTVCGISIENMIKRFVMDKALDKSVEKSALRSFGMEMSFEAIKKNNPELVEYKCPAAGQGGFVVVRYISGNKTVAAGMESNTTSVNVLFMYLDGAGKPDYMKTLTSSTISGTNIPTMKVALTETLSDVDSKEQVTFVQIPAMASKMSLVTHSENFENGKTRVTTWTDGKLTQISNFKNNLLHGSTETMEIKTSWMGKEYTTPGFKRCYKNGLEIKTTGDCNVD